MTLKSRPYQGIQDFIVMTSILTVGRKTSEKPYYVHTGDLSWWMFYDDHDDSYWHEHVKIWEIDGRTIGWSMCDPEWYSFDVNLLPEIRGTREETYILDWTIKRVSSSVKENGGSKIRTVWVSEFDDERIRQLEKRGFIKDEGYMWYMEHPLNAQIPELSLPQDYIVRPIKGESEVQVRASTPYRGFRSNHRFSDFWLRYQRFVKSPVYNPAFDLVTESPDGQLASFCVIWPDPVNRIGLFEPVGAHSSFQMMGLRKAVVTAGLNQLRACGMNEAMTCVEHNNPAALGFFGSVGFKKKYKLHTFRKSV